MKRSTIHKIFTVVSVVIIVLLVLSWLGAIIWLIINS